GQWGLVRTVSIDVSTGSQLMRLALNGDELLLSVPEINQGRGVVRLHVRHQGGSNAWGLVTVVAQGTSTNDNTGASLMLRGDTAFIGVPREDTVFDEGVIEVRQRNQGGAGAWGLVTTLQSSDRAMSDQLGWRA